MNKSPYLKTMLDINGDLEASKRGECYFLPGGNQFKFAIGQKVTGIKVDEKCKRLIVELENGDFLRVDTSDENESSVYMIPNYIEREPEPNDLKLSDRALEDESKNESVPRGSLERMVRLWRSFAIRLQPRRLWATHAPSVNADKYDFLYESNHLRHQKFVGNLLSDKQNYNLKHLELHQ